jgi:D-alanine-D-alanine ligase-like ATP-grasp enzyme
LESPYTTTITDEAKKRGIRVVVIDPDTPIYNLVYKSKKIRCCRSLTDRVGAITFQLTQNKHLANSFLKKHGFSVPAQELFENYQKAEIFLKQFKNIVVKPCSQWGARGVSVKINNKNDLRAAVRSAAKFEGDIILEEYVNGEDNRLIFVDYRFVAAVRRFPAYVTGNGKDSLRNLIRKKNIQAKKLDPVNVVPFDRETLRSILAKGFGYESVPKKGRKIEVRMNANYHTGGIVEVVTDQVRKDLVDTAKKIVRLAELPVCGVDFLVNKRTGKYWVVELAPDLAISPRGGKIVAKYFIDYLFPETIKKSGKL